MVSYLWQKDGKYYGLDGSVYDSLPTNEEIIGLQTYAKQFVNDREGYERVFNENVSEVLGRGVTDEDYNADTSCKMSICKVDATVKTKYGTEKTVETCVTETDNGCYDISFVFPDLAGRSDLQSITKYCLSPLDDTLSTDYTLPWAGVLFTDNLVRDENTKAKYAWFPNAASSGGFIPMSSYVTYAYIRQFSEPQALPNESGVAQGRYSYDDPSKGLSPWSLTVQGVVVGEGQQAPSIWMTIGRFQNDNQGHTAVTWDTPVRMTDTNDFQTEWAGTGDTAADNFYARYSRGERQLPTLDRYIDNSGYTNIERWEEDCLLEAPSYGKWLDKMDTPKYMAYCSCNNGKWGPWTVTKVMGDNGKPGADARPNVMAFASTHEGEVPPTPTGGTYNHGEVTDIEPDGVWYTDEQQQEGMIRWLSNGTWDNTEDPANPVLVWTTPVRITGKDGENGVDGEGREFIYRRFEDMNAYNEYLSSQDYQNNFLPYTTWDPSVTSAETASTSTYQQDGFIPDSPYWYDSPRGITEEYRVEVSSIRAKKVISAFSDKPIWDVFSAPIIWASWGEDGIDGDGVEYIFCITNEANYVYVLYSGTEEPGEYEIVSELPSDIDETSPDFIRLGETGPFYSKETSFPSGVVLPPINFVENTTDPGIEDSLYRAMLTTTLSEDQKLTLKEYYQQPEFVPGEKIVEDMTNPSSSLRKIAQRHNNPNLDFLTAGTTTLRGDWTDNPSDVGPDKPFEWVSTRKYKRGDEGKQWEPFTEPKLWAKYGYNGTSVSVSSTSVRYAITIIDRQPDDSSFIYTEVPPLRQGDYLWVKEEITFTDGTVVKSYSVSRVGEDGASGQTGPNGSCTHFAYATSSDGSENFSVVMFTGATYVGTYTDQIIEDSTAYTDYNWTKLQGDSVTIVSSVTKYKATTSSTQPDPSEFISTVIPPLALGDYLWEQNTITFSDDTDVVSYTVSRIGADGPSGATGPNGSCTHFAYATSADGSQNFSTTMFTGATYIGTYTDQIIEDSDDYTDYNWTKLKGDEGERGKEGAKAWYSTYTDGTAYRSGTGETEEFYDVVLHSSYGYFYRCLKSYPASETHEPLNAESSVYWEYMPGYETVVADMLLANQAFINELTTNKLKVKDTNNMTILYAGDEEYPLQCGSNIEGGVITTTISSDGELNTTSLIATGGEIGGWKINDTELTSINDALTLDASAGTLNFFDGSGNTVTQIDGIIYNNLDDVLNTQGTVNIGNGTSNGYISCQIPGNLKSGNTYTEVFVLSSNTTTFTVPEGVQSLRITGVRLKFSTGGYNSPDSGCFGSIHSEYVLEDITDSQTYSFDEADNDWTGLGDTECPYYRNLTYYNGQSVNITGLTAAHVYRVYPRITIYYKEAKSCGLVGGPTIYFEYSHTRTGKINITTPQNVNRFFGNGIAIADSSSNYFLVGNKRVQTGSHSYQNQMVLKLETTSSSGSGIEITDNSFKIKKSGYWLTLSGVTKDRYVNIGKETVVREMPGVSLSISTLRRGIVLITDSTSGETVTLTRSMDSKYDGTECVIYNLSNHTLKLKAPARTSTTDSNWVYTYKFTGGSGSLIASSGDIANINTNERVIIRYATYENNNTYYSIVEYQ